MSEATRRRSSVGNIGLGDNTAPSFATMHQSHDSQRASRNRQRALSGEKMVRAANGKVRTVPTNKPRATGVRRLWLRYREVNYKNTWVTPLLLLVLIYAVYWINPGQQNPLHQFLFLSYKVPGSSPAHYGKGVKDFCFCAFYMLFFTFFREFCMQVVLRPIAKYCGIKKQGKVNRFLEQSYSMIYYSLAGPFGLYIMYHSPIWYFNTTSFYEHYPHKTHEMLFKLFYLLQASFWAQQSVVLMLQLEKPRKDFQELVFHHIVTMALIFLSYRFHFTWIGLAIYVTMDVSDLFLATSKVMNYLDSGATGPFFILFMMVWIYLRHYINIKVLYSICTEFSTVGDFTLNWETEQYKCWISQYITFALLLALQLVNSYWLFLICRIAYRYVFQNIQKDERSDDEEDDEDEEDYDDYSPGESPIEEKKQQ